MKDRYGREIDYMRISITDRCDLRCRYCMPYGCEKVPMDRVLTYQEIERIARLSSDLGINKLKITGGEPFVRLGCVDLIRNLKMMPKIQKVTVTTNGQTLEKYIDDLRSIGVDGINISLDTMDAERFSFITGGGMLEKTLRGIDASMNSGIKTKINCVLQKGFNEDEILSFAEKAFETGTDVRFIEMMPIGMGRTRNGVSNKYVLQTLKEHWPGLEYDSTVRGNGPAVYYHLGGKKGSIGFISAIHDKFCDGCNRIRLTSQGQIRQCLCYDDSFDLIPYLRSYDADDGLLREKIRESILMKPKAHCFNNKPVREDRRTGERLMSQIGG